MWALIAFICSARSISHWYMSSNTHHKLFAVAALLFAATAWGVIWYPLRLIEAQGLSGLWTTLVMFSAASVVVLPALWGCRRQIRRHWFQILLIMLFSGWTNIGFILAVLDGNIVRVLLLFYLSPVWAILLARFVLNERIGWHGLLILFIALCGALLMLWNPEFGGIALDSKADYLAITAGIAFAANNVMVRRASMVEVRCKTSATLWGTMLLCGTWVAVVSLPGAVSLPDVSWNAYLNAALLGCFGILFMTLTVQYGVSRLPIKHSAIILLFEVVAGAISAQLLTNEQVLPQEWVGGVMIILAGYVSARRVLESK